MRRSAVVSCLAAALLVMQLGSSATAAPPSWNAQPVARGELTANVSASGTLNAVILVEVGSQISGQISQLMADFNSVVKANDVIARIEPATYEARLAQAAADLQVAQAAVPIQRAQIERSHADVRNLDAALDGARAQVTRAALAVDDAKRDYDRKKPLYEHQVVSASDWDKAQNIYQSAQAQLVAARAQEAAQEAQILSAQATLRMAEAQLDSLSAQVAQKEAARAQAQIDLDHTYIRAPVDGVVVSRNVNIGQTVAASLQAPTLFTIAQDLTLMQVDSSVAEADVGRVRVGQAASFTVDAYPGRRFTGEVLQVRKAPQIVQNVVTYDVVVSASNPAGDLLPGMTANLSILVAHRDSALKVPNAALRFRPPAGTVTPASPPRPPSEDGQPGLPGRVYVIGAAGQPAPVHLRIGITDGSMTEVLAGELREGQEVIIGGAAGAAATTSRFPRLF